MNRFDRPRRILAIAIAFLAGGVDALGFLSADRYFVSFMSGNTTRLAVELVTEPRHAVTPALLIGDFVIGVAGGSLLATWAGAWRKVALLASVAILLALAAAAHKLGADAAALGAMVLAMGAINNSFQRDGQTVGLTYMTGALVRLGQGLAAVLTRDGGRDWGTYLLLWAGLLGGAVGGAVLFVKLGEAAVWLAALFAAVLALAAWRITARGPRFANFRPE